MVCKLAFKRFGGDMVLNREERSESEVRMVTYTRVCPTFLKSMVACGRSSATTSFD